MNTRERIRNIFEFKPVDRIPQLEWGPWWSQTLARWRREGLNPALADARWIQKKTPIHPPQGEVGDELGLDPFRVIWLRTQGENLPQPETDGGGIVTCREDYLRIKPFLFPEPAFDFDCLAQLHEAQEKEGMALWMWVDGFFWTPRVLFGIQEHLLAFYDQPELMCEMNADLLNYYERVLPELFSVAVPDILFVAEDLSYNNGPMISRACFEEFIAPYYRPLVRLLKSHGIHPFMDSDGDIMPIIPWLKEIGVEGIGPLERMAGTDLVALRKQYPELLLAGGFDKTVISQGEAAMRREFERLRPVVASGGYLPMVDHQTPPEVSLENYRLYWKLFQEYCRP